MPNSVPTPASAGSGLSLNVRVWKIFAPLAFSIDVRRDSFEPTTVDFCESVDIREGLVDVAVDSPAMGDDVDDRPVFSPLLENDLLLRGRAALDSASMCSNTDDHPSAINQANLSPEYNRHRVELHHRPRAQLSGTPCNHTPPSRERCTMEEAG